MYPHGNPPQPLRAVPHGVHARYNRKQNLSGAHVACRLFPADVLLARLQRHAECRLPVGISGDADNSAGNQALEFVARGEERSMRSAVAEGNAETLAVTDDDVRPPLARRSEQ